MSDQSVTPWKDAPAVWVSAVICFSSLVAYSSAFVMKDLAEVCPLSRGMMLQSLFPPLQKDVRFLRLPLPAISLAHLAAAYRKRKISGLPCSAQIPEWVRSALFAGGLGCPRGSRPKSLFPPRCRLAQACQHLRLVLGNDVYRAFTCVDHATQP